MAHIESLMIDPELDKVATRILETNERIARQRKVVQQFEALGDLKGANKARGFLNTLEDSLRIFRAQRDIALQRHRRPRAASRSPKGS